VTDEHTDINGLTLEINGVDVTELLRAPNATFLYMDPDPTPTITVSAEQFRQIAAADAAARNRLGDGRIDSRYFRDELEKILDKADFALLEQGTARLVVSKL